MLEEALYDESAERCVIGSILRHLDFIYEVFDYLDETDFYNQELGKLYGILKDYSTDYSEVDEILLLEYIKDSNLQVDQEGLYQLVYEGVDNKDIFLSICNNIVKEKSNIRQIRNIILSYSSFDNIITNISNLLLKTQITKKHKQNIYDIYQLSFRDKLLELEAKKELITGLASGFSKLDTKTTGFHNGELIVLGARTGMGKTAFALNMALNMAKNGNKVLFFSLEMSEEQIMQRIVSIVSKIDLYKIRTGFISDAEQKMIDEIFTKQSDIFKNIDVITDIVDINQLKIEAQASVKQNDIKVIFIDYLQLIRPSRRNNNGTRYEIVSQISLELKAMAKQLNIPIISLAQLSRQTENRSDKRPHLSDLRESGQIEQDADLIMFLHRPEYYKKDPLPEEKNLAELLIAKNRQGETGIINFTFIKETTAFIERLEEIEEYIAYEEDDEGKDKDTNNNKIKNILKSSM